LHVLHNSTVLGVSPGNLSLLRLDQSGGLAPGNKSFKLRDYLARAREQGITRLVSFGGAWSNHLHALAAVGHHSGIDTVGIIRGETSEETSSMLEDARRWGMRIIHVSREEYRRRHDREYQQEVTRRFAPCLLIPEGGASVIGARGCGAIADRVRESAPDTRRIVLPVGTGTTLGGLVASLDSRYEIVGISALKGAADLEDKVRELLTDLRTEEPARWQILHDYHCGGFARANPALREFILAFEAVQGVPLEPVYTGKMLFAIHELSRRGEWDTDTPTLAIHTGGLQGRRGYSWLE
jgi:1-aminocyclopropane-1-carboxylate deaminase